MNMVIKVLPLVFSLLAFSVFADEPNDAGASLEPCINGSVSANGLFPTQAIEEEFTAYLRWTKDEGLSRLVAFEYMLDLEGESPSGRFPTQAMEEQFLAYIQWVNDRRISPFYAFGISDFD